MEKVKEEKFNGKIQGYFPPKLYRKFIKLASSKSETESGATRRMITKLITLLEDGTVKDW